MTLIARVLFDGFPACFADALIVTEEEPWDPRTIVAASDVNKLLPKDTKYNIAGMKQKLNLLSDRLMVAWAGSEYQARQILKGLLYIAESDSLSLETIGAFINSAKPEDIDNLALIGILATPDANGIKIENFDMGVSIVTGKHGRSSCEITAAGSGKKSFIEAIPDFLKEINSDVENTVKADELALGLIGMFFSNELLTGGNLMEWWGGAFEIATFQNNAIRKYSNILFTFWRVIPKKDNSGCAELFLVSRFVKQSYYEDVLVIQDVTSKIINGSMEPPCQGIHFILPLLKIRSDYNFSEYKTTELDCTTLCVFVLPSNEMKSEDVGVRIYHDSDGEKRFLVTVASDRLELKIESEIVMAIEDDISSTLGVGCKFSGLSN